MCVPPVGTHSASGLLTALCQQSAALDWGGSARHTTRPPACAQVAQLAEQGTENPRVGGSIPPLGTKLRVVETRPMVLSVRKPDVCQRSRRRADRGDAVRTL